MNDTIKTIQNHVSIRRFTDQVISPELFEQLILCGQAAATSSFIQAVSVIRITGSTIRAELVELTGKQKYVGSAAEFLVICADLNRNWQRVKETNPDADFSWTEQFLAASIDASLFAQNTVVAAESAGLGCCYIGGIRNNPERVIELLELPDLVFPLFGLCLGYPDQDPGPKPRLPLASVVHQNRYSYSSEEADLIDIYDQHIKEYYIQRSSGKLDFTWTQQMAKQAQTQARPFIKKVINNSGLASK